MLGGINVVAEDNALLSIDPNANLGAAFTQVSTEFRDIQNYFPLNRGGQSRTFGFTLHKDFGAGLITGLYRYKKSDGTNLFLVSQGNTLYKLVSGTATSLSTSLQSNAYTDFTTALDNCIICDGTNTPFKFDGTTVSTLAGSPPSGARQSLFYKNRLFIFSATSDTSLLYYSDGGNIETGYASNFVNCDNNDGQAITGIKEIFIPGQLEPLILVTKERSVGIVTGDGTASNPFTFIKILQDIGVKGFRQIVPYDQDVSFLTPRGVHSYLLAASDVNLAQNLLSRNVYPDFLDLSSTTLPIAFAFYDWPNYRIGYAVATGSNTYPDTIWWYDTQAKSMYKQTGFNLTAVMVDEDGTMYHGDNTGKVYSHSKNTHNYNGSPITSVLKFGYFDFYEPMLYKQIEEATIHARGDGEYNFSISTTLDYGVQTGASNTISLTAGAYKWGQGTWTDDPNVYQWGASPMSISKFFPQGMFKAMQFEITHTGTDQPIDIFELDFIVKYLDKT